MSTMLGWAHVMKQRAAKQLGLKLAKWVAGRVCVCVCVCVRWSVCACAGRAGQGCCDARSSRQLAAAGRRLTPPTLAPSPRNCCTQLPPPPARCTPGRRLPQPPASGGCGGSSVPAPRQRLACPPSALAPPTPSCPRRHLPRSFDIFNADYPDTATPSTRDPSCALSYGSRGDLGGNTIYDNYPASQPAHIFLHEVGMGGRAGGLCAWLRVRGALRGSGVTLGGSARPQPAYICLLEVCVCTGRQRACLCVVTALWRRSCRVCVSGGTWRLAARSGGCLRRWKGWPRGREAPAGARTLLRERGRRMGFGACWGCGHPLRYPQRPAPHLATLWPPSRADAAQPGPHPRQLLGRGRAAQAPRQGQVRPARAPPPAGSEARA